MNCHPLSRYVCSSLQAVVVLSDQETEDLDNEDNYVNTLGNCDLYGQRTEWLIQ